MSSPALVPSLDQYRVLVPIQISDVSFAIGYLLNFGLLGVLSVQVCTYVTRFRCDARCLQLAVLFVFVLEVFNSVLVLYSAVYGASIRCMSCLVTGQREYLLYGVPTSETLSTWAFKTLCVLTGLSSSAVQIFFAWRIWVLGKSVWIPISVVVLSSAQCVLLAIDGVVNSYDPALGVFDTDGAVAWLLVGAFCDVVITFRTTQLLLQSQKTSGCPATQLLVRKLIELTVQTGLATVLTTLLEFMVARRFGIAHHGIFYFLSKVYANCLLNTLNARTAMKEEPKHNPASSLSEEIVSPARPGPLEVGAPDAPPLHRPLPVAAAIQAATVHVHVRHARRASHTLELELGTHLAPVGRNWSFEA